MFGEQMEGERGRRINCRGSGYCRHQSSSTKSFLPCTIFSNPPLQNALTGLSVSKHGSDSKVCVSFFTMEVKQTLKVEFGQSRVLLKHLSKFKTSTLTNFGGCGKDIKTVITSFALEHQRFKSLTGNVQCRQSRVGSIARKSTAQCNCPRISNETLCESSFISWDVAR